MKRFQTILLIIGFVTSTSIGISLTVDAATIRVPEDHATIQLAIDVASDGDIVLVADGEYKGSGNRNLDFNGKAITLKSRNGAKSTIISGIYAESDSEPKVVNTILWFDEPDEIAGDGSDTISVTYSDIQGRLWEGEGNIEAPPLFVDIGVESCEEFANYDLLD